MRLWKPSLLAAVCAALAAAPAAPAAGTGHVCPFPKHGSLANGFAQKVTVTGISCATGDKITDAYVSEGFHGVRSTTLTVDGFHCRKLGNVGHTTPNGEDGHYLVGCVRPPAKVTFVVGP